MDLAVAAALGAAGGVTAVLVTFSSDVISSGNHWPWHEEPETKWPRVIVSVIYVAVSAILAAVNAGQVSGPVPAFVLGVTAPAVVRGMLAKVGYDVAKPEEEGESADANAP